MKGIDDSHRFQKLAAREWVGRNLPLILVMITVFVLIVVIESFQLPEPKRHVTVGCVLVGGKTDGGWNESHYKGIWTLAMATRILPACWSCGTTSRRRRPPCLPP